MIDYDGRSWLPILFRMRGSVIPRLLPRIVVTTALGVAAVLLLESRNFKIPSVAHALVGVALGLLLVFRTNASYDRYWEGRKLIGFIVNRTRISRGKRRPMSSTRTRGLRWRSSFPRSTGPPRRRCDGTLRSGQTPSVC